MLEVQGLSAAPGIGIGKLCFVPYQKRSIPEYNIHKNDVGSELERFSDALKMVEEDLFSLHEELVDSDAEKAKFIMVHRMILRDPLLYNTIEAWLHEKLSNIESLLFRFATGIEQTFKKIENPMFAERTSDMQDVTHRVIDALLGHKRDDVLGQIREECIVVAYDIYPSDAVSLDPQYVRGIVTETGGVTSHTAILARSFGIPAVVGIENLLRSFQLEDFDNACPVVVNGNLGKAYFDLDEGELEQYRLLQQQRKDEQNNHLEALQPKVPTQDGQDVYLYANMGSLAELNSPYLPFSSGIGLFRSEFLFLEKIPTEEEQYRAYIKILAAVAEGQEVTIRTIDMGGDKVPVTGLLTESNPLLGCRAIRLAMSYPEDLFRPQVRAIYRSAAYAEKNKLGKIRMLLPLISSHIELVKAKEFILETRQGLLREGFEAPQVPIGAMIELPSAALCSDIIAKDVDFFSIGTNDLVQYTLGIDRINEKVAHLYDPLQVGVLKLIQITIINANEEKIPVAMCGEMASDPRATAILLGLGLRHFSMNSYSLVETAYTIRGFDVQDCEDLAHNYITTHNYEKAQQLLLDWHRERGIELSIPEWGF